MLGLEVASGNDALASHSAIRKTAKLMLQFIPGTDFIFSGYSAVPKRDNLFGGGNFDAEDFDDYNVLQRDMQIDGGTRPIAEEEALAIRREAARAIQAIYAELGFPPIDDAEVEAAVVAHGSEDMPLRDVVADLAAADRFLAGEQTIVAVIAALQTARLRADRRQHPGDGPPARRRRLPPAGGDLRLAVPRAERNQRSERLQRPRHRLPVERGALARSAGASPGPVAARLHRRPDRRAGRGPGRVRPRAPRLRARSARGGRAGLRHRADPDDRRPGARGRAGGDPHRRRARGADGADRQGLPQLGLRRHRPRRRPDSAAPGSRSGSSRAAPP